MTTMTEIAQSLQSDFESRAAELDPLTPLHTVWIPALHWFSGDYERALEEALPLLAKYPENHIIWNVAARSAAYLGRLDEAAESYRKFLDIWKNATPEQPEMAEARRALERIERSTS